MRAFTPLERSALLAFCLLLAFGAPVHAQGDAIRVDNSSRFTGSRRYDWTVYLVLRDEKVLDQIEYVEYTLHPSFSNPKRRVYQRGTQKRAFPLSSNGWGEFNIAVKVVFKRGGAYETDYWLKLEDDRNNEKTTTTQKKATRKKG